MGIKHAFTMPGPDDPTKDVSTIRWNDDLIVDGDVDWDGNKITGLGAPTDPNDAARLADVGGAAGASRLLDLGVVNAVDLLDGTVTLYTPAAGEIVGPVLLRDAVFLDVQFIVIGRQEQVYGDQSIPPLATVKTNDSTDGYGQLYEAGKLPTTTGPVTAYTNYAGIFEAPIRGRWQPLTVYAMGDYVSGSDDHFWEATTGGTSGVSEPDFVGNHGGTVVDGAGPLEWIDHDAAQTVGSAHVYAYVVTPVVP